jgi:subtilisin-like proprotein convertase family protein
MSAINYNFIIEQGSAFEIIFQYYDSNGSSVDLTNWCALLQCRTDANNILSFSNKYDGSAYSMTTDTLGRIILQIPSKTSIGYTFGSAVYDLDLQEPNEQYPNSGLKTYRLATGTISIARRNIDPALSDCASATSGFQANVCNIECGKLDIYSAVYDGGSLTVPDMTSVSGTISTNDTRLIENVELAINGLRHNSPQDLTLILAPPSGNKILLSSHNKINNYVPGFSFMFSNKAAAGAYINNINSGAYCNISNKTSTTRYNGETLLSSFDHLFNSAVNGQWKFCVIDDDIGASGTIDSWKLIVTYK